MYQFMSKPIVMNIRRTFTHYAPFIRGSDDQMYHQKLVRRVCSFRPQNRAQNFVSWVPSAVCCCSSILGFPVIPVQGFLFLVDQNTKYNIITSGVRCTVSYTRASFFFNRRTSEDAVLRLQKNRSCQKSVQYAVQSVLKKKTNKN